MKEIILVSIILHIFVSSIVASKSKYSGKCVNKKGEIQPRRQKKTGTEIACGAAKALCTNLVHQLRK